LYQKLTEKFCSGFVYCVVPVALGEESEISSGWATEEEAFIGTLINDDDLV
jgi:hypothetical protein